MGLIILFLFFRPYAIIFQHTTEMKQNVPHEVTEILLRIHQTIQSNLH